MVALIALLFVGAHSRHFPPLTLAPPVFPNSNPQGVWRARCVWFLLVASLSGSRSGLWAAVRFRRAVGVAGGFVLCGLPESLFEVVCARLFVLGCEFVACGSSLGSRSVWLCFVCRAEVAGRLALVFPAPPGSVPLLVSASGRVLSGAAESRARAARSGRGSLGVAVQVACCGGSSELPLS